MAVDKKELKKKYSAWRQHLTYKRESFCRHYVMNGGNACQAYRDSHDTSRMTEKTLQEEASRMMKKPGIATKIAQIQRENMEESTIDFTWLMDELLQLYQKLKEGDKPAPLLKTLDLISKQLSFHKLSEDHQSLIDKLELNEIEQKIEAVKAKQAQIKDVDQS